MYGYDATHANAGSIPANAEYVFGYVTGSSDIWWRQSDYDRFPHATKEYIDQGNGAPWRTPTIIDVEYGAYAPAQIPSLVARYPGVKVYCNQSTIASVYKTGYRGQIWVAAPGQNASQVKANTEKVFPGLHVFAVQDVWGKAIDRSTIFPVTVPAPPPPTINIDGFKIRRPGVDVPAVISWWGDSGITRRQTVIPRVIWNAIKWVLK